jgi:nucleotide-binding universal stress UspA family protein
VSEAKEVLVAYDDSEAARAAMRWATSYASERERSVLVINVIPSLSEWELAAIQVDTNPLRRRLEALLRTDWTALLREAGVPYRTKLKEGRPAEVILETARKSNAELIVIGMTERGLLHELVLGATVRRVMHQALRPVVAVPATWAAAGSSDVGARAGKAQQSAT